MLFRLIQNPDYEGDGLLGYEWIEVLSVEPWAIRAQPSTDLGEWAFAEIATQYICRVPSWQRPGGTELIRLTTDDVWTAMGERSEWLDHNGEPEYIEDQEGEVFCCLREGETIPAFQKN